MKTSHKFISIIIALILVVAAYTLGRYQVSSSTQTMAADNCPIQSVAFTPVHYPDVPVDIETPSPASLAMEVGVELDYDSLNGFWKPRFAGNHSWEVNNSYHDLVRRFWNDGHYYEAIALAKQIRWSQSTLLKLARDQWETLPFRQAILGDHPRTLPDVYTAIGRYYYNKEDPDPEKAAAMFIEADRMDNDHCRSN